MRRLYRSRENSIIGGVCGGLAEYLDVDPTIVRLAWILTVFAGGIGFALYLAAWLVIPPQPGYRRDDDWQWATRARQEDRREEVEVDVDPTTAADERAAPQPRPARETTMTGRRVERDHGPRTLGIILVLLGGFLLARNLLPWLNWGRFWPLALVLLGVWIIVTAVRGER